MPVVAVFWPRTAAVAALGTVWVAVKVFAVASCGKAAESMPSSRSALRLGTRALLVTVKGTVAEVKAAVAAKPLAPVKVCVPLSRATLGERRVSLTVPRAKFVALGCTGLVRLPLEELAALLRVTVVL